MLVRILFFAMLASLLLLTLILQATNPNDAGAVGILAVFVLAYIFCVCVLSFFMFVVSKIMVKALNVFTARRPLEYLTLKRSYYYASVLALAPVITIGMQSVGEFGLYELGLVVLLVGIGCLYVSKRTG